MACSARNYRSEAAGTLGSRSQCVRSCRQFVCELCSLHVPAHSETNMCRWRKHRPPTLVEGTLLFGGSQSQPTIQPTSEAVKPHIRGCSTLRARLVLPGQAQREIAREMGHLEACGTGIRVGGRGKRRLTVDPRSWSSRAAIFRNSVAFLPPIFRAGPPRNSVTSRRYQLRALRRGDFRGELANDQQQTPAGFWAAWHAVTLHNWLRGQRAGFFPGNADDNRQYATRCVVSPEIFPDCAGKSE
jgi:hypothetical protein